MFPHQLRWHFSARNTCTREYASTRCGAVKAITLLLVQATQAVLKRKSCILVFRPCSSSCCQPQLGQHCACCIFSAAPFGLQLATFISTFFFFFFFQLSKAFKSLCRAIFTARLTRTACAARIALQSAEKNCLPAACLKAEKKSAEKKKKIAISWRGGAQPKTYRKYFDFDFDFDSLRPADEMQLKARCKHTF